MVSPIDVATQGLLDSPLSVAAIRGRLTIAATPPPTGPGGGLGFGAARVVPWTHPQVLKDQLMRQAEREDDEIMAVIKAFLRIKQ
jgi:hypothetical protein